MGRIQTVVISVATNGWANLKRPREALAKGARDLPKLPRFLAAATRTAASNARSLLPF